jgi:GNAT superfamily N-acetyltransferase
MSDVELRVVGPDDWALWRGIRLRALKDAPTAFGSTYESSVHLTEADFRDRLSGEAPSVLALAGGDPVAMGGGFLDLEGWLRAVSMWVDPAWRGRGLGGRVLDLLVAWSRDRGLRVHLDVTVGNDVARAMYERHGFAGTGELEELRPGSAYQLERMVLADHLR